MIPKDRGEGGYPHYSLITRGFVAPASCRQRRERIECTGRIPDASWPTGRLQGCFDSAATSLREVPAPLSMTVSERMRDNLTRGSLVMACCFQRSCRPLQVLALDEHVVGVERRDRKDRSLRLGQRLEERREHPGHRKWKRPRELQRDPAQFDANAFRQRMVFTNPLFANNGKLVRGPRHRKKSTRQRPRRDRRAGSQLAHRQWLRKNAIFQMVGQTPRRVLQNRSSEFVGRDS